MQVYIKNMVCNRCVAAVKTLLEKEGLPYRNIQLGQVDLEADPGPESLERLRVSLMEEGFELLDDRKSRLVEQIKTTIISAIQGYREVDLNVKLSVVLEKELHKDYHYLSNLFSSTEGVTIEKYAILQRIEKVKELLKYGELTLSEIAFELGYSSVQHLSQQFKKITGLTPSAFRQLKENTRKSLDQV